MKTVQISSEILQTCKQALHLSLISYYELLDKPTGRSIQTIESLIARTDNAIAEVDHALKLTATLKKQI